MWRFICDRDGDYGFYMIVKGYHYVKPLVRKARVRLRVIDHFGIPFFICKYREHWHYAVGIGTFFLVLHVISPFIWDTQFDGNYRYAHDILIRYLDSQDIDYGVLRSKINCKNLESSIRTSSPKTTWVSAKVSDTRLLIRIKESEVLSIMPEKDKAPCDIVTPQVGTIISTVVRQEIVQVSVGNEMEEGQVLVSGCVPIIGDSEEEISMYMVYTDADVVARTTKGYEKIIPLFYREWVQTGRKCREWYVKAGKQPFTPLIPVRGQGEWGCAMKEQQLKLFSNLYLPPCIGGIKGREMFVHGRNHTWRELECISKAINYQFVKDSEKKGVQILENNDRTKTSVSQCRIKGELVTQKSIVKT